MIELFTGRQGTFRHGVHPAENKDATAALPIERVAFVDEYVLPLSQHIGAPSRPAVRVGEHVDRGQLIARPGGFVSVALHAPVSGTVRAIERRLHPNGKRTDSIVIACDRFASQQDPVSAPVDPTALLSGALATLIQQAGLVGLGGAAFPTHVKLSVPQGKHVRYVLLNGCECEPYLTCDHRIMVERPEVVLRGMQLIMEQVGAVRGVIGIETNKPDAIVAMRQAAAAAPTGTAPIEVVPLRVKYPQGAEKMLIDAIYQREVPSGKLPLDLEMVVQNVGTAAAIADLVDHGMPLIERVVTVSGPGIRRPANLIVPLGTPVRALIEHCGGVDSSTTRVIMGGPMMGMAQKSLDVPVLKGTSGILALMDPAEDAVEQPCIRCGRCLDACPHFLNPQRFSALTRHERGDALAALNVLDCVECASCSFVCPSRIPLVQLIRVGKSLVRAAHAKRQAAEKAAS